MPPKLDSKDIVRRLKTQAFGRTLTIIDECSSTNDVAREMGERGAPHGLVIIAESQTRGRGRLGRAWYSPRGGVWMSVLLRPGIPPMLLDSLPLIGALGVTKTLVELWKVNARVRWPNDVMVDERKLAGVLVESRVKGNQLVYAVLGIGVNVNFESSLIHQTSKTSTSLLTLLGHHVDREGLIADVLYGIERMYDSICRSEQPELVDLLRQMDCSRGKRVRVKTARKEVTGIIEDYQSLTEVRIITRDGCRVVGLDSLESVDYESD